jgi:hypothetical protein
MNRKESILSDESEGLRGEPLLFVGDLYEGAYGPTIILMASSPVACAWLQDVFRELAHGAPSRTLTAEPKMQFTNVEVLEVVCRPGSPRITLRHRDDIAEKSFVWSATAGGWLYLADLIQSLADGAAGHEYLTEDRDGVALVELSSGEQEVLDAVKSAVTGPRPVRLGSA